MPEFADAFNVLCLDIARRLAPVCSHLPEEDFRRLVRDIAATKLRHGLSESQLESLRRRYAPAGGTPE